MELEGGEEFVMEEASGVSKGVSDNSRTSACFREHLHFPVTVVCLRGVVDFSAASVSPCCCCKFNATCLFHVLPPSSSATQLCQERTVVF